MPLVELTPDGELIDVHVMWTEKDLIRQIPGALYDGYRSTWTLPKSWAAHCQLRGIFTDSLTVGPRMAEWVWSEYERRVKPARALRDVIAAEGPDVWRPYQLADVQFLLTSGNTLLANDPGTGKTVSTLTALRSLGPESLPVLIICPKSVMGHWYRHFGGSAEHGIRPWFPEATPYLVTGGVQRKRKALDSASIDASAAIIINVEAVRLHSRLAPYGSVRLNRCAECLGHSSEPEITPVPSSRCEVHLKELNFIQFKTVILDEAHMIKDPLAKQTRAVWYVGQQESVRTKWALTGTPIANHVGDLWTVMHFLQENEYPTRTPFIDRYALFTWNDYGTMSISDVRPDTRDELFRFLDPRMRRMLKDVVLPQLPPKVWETHEADMTPRQGKMYRELEEEMFTRTSTGELLMVTNNLTRNLRLLQLASSSAEIERTYEYNEQTGQDDEHLKVILHEPSSKVDVMMEKLTAVEGRQVVVSAMSRQLIELAHARLEKNGVSAGMITGKVGQFDRDRNLAEFRAGRLRVLLFTLGAGGIGVDMTAASVMIRLQRSYSMIHNVQGLGRIDRIGAEVHDSLHIIDVIAPGTVEEDQLERIRAKEERLETIVRDRIARAKAGLPTEAYDQEIEVILNTQLLPPMQETQT